MIRKLSYYIRGAVKLTAEGPYPERFINLCVAQRLGLWGVRKNGEILQIWIRPRDFFRIRPIVRKTGMKVKVTGRYGFPFFFKRMKSRKTFLLGGAVFVCMLYFLSGFVWVLDITGTRTVSDEALAEVAYLQGLHVGAPIDGIRTREIEKDLLLQFPELAWAGIHFTGTKAVIEVVEKVLPPAEDKSARDLVAAKSGMITECIVLEGEKTATVGTWVTEGAVLIRGGAAEDAKRAQGIVKARVVYVNAGEVALNEDAYAPTEDMRYGISLRYSAEAVTVWNVGEEPFSAYEYKQFVKKIPWWRNSGPAVELIIDEYRRLQYWKSERNFTEAKQAATARAMAECQAMIPEDAAVLARTVEIEDSGDPNLVRVKVKIETEEEIGKYIRYAEE